MTSSTEAKSSSSRRRRNKPPKSHKPPRPPHPGPGYPDYPAPPYDYLYYYNPPSPGFLPSSRPMPAALSTGGGGTITASASGSLSGGAVIGIAVAVVLAVALAVALLVWRCCPVCCCKKKAPASNAGIVVSTGMWVPMTATTEGASKPAGGEGQRPRIIVTVEADAV